MKRDSDGDESKTSHSLRKTAKGAALVSRDRNPGGDGLVVRWCQADPWVGTSLPWGSMVVPVVPVV